MHVPGSTNPFLFAAGLLFLAAAAYAFVRQGDARIGTMSVGLAVANVSLGW